MFKIASALFKEDLSKLCVPPVTQHILLGQFDTMVADQAEMYYEKRPYTSDILLIYL
jgi:hypothetical protein